MPSAVQSSSRAIAPVFRGVMDMIGNTPMLEITRLDTGPCRLFVKLEQQNPGSSIKDRIAVSMIEQAEADGALRPGGSIVEATAGNTGIALALVAAQKGYTLTVVVPDKMSAEKVSHLRAMGAKVLLTRSDVEKGHPEYYQDIAERISRETGAYYVNQFGNRANPRAHYTTTGPEIWQQMKGHVDALVAGVGSAGTIAGCGRFLRERHPAIEIILADPEGSVLAPLVNENRKIQPGSWLVEGIGEDFVPENLDLSIIDKAYSVSDRDAFLAARELLLKEGILAGSSTGTLLAGALRYCREQTGEKRVVTFVCDHGAKYLSKMFNDFWMIDQKFIERPTFGDLRDLITRRHLDREDYCLKPTTPISQAIKAMELYSISQMAVVDEKDRVVGIIDESDVLVALTGNGNVERQPVSNFMTSKVRTVPPTAKVAELLPLFRADLVAVVADETHFYGLITKIDLINDLRRRLR
jgi:cystathionine beta-synthase